MEDFYSFGKKKIFSFPETHKNVCVCLHGLYASHQPINPAAKAAEIFFFDYSFVYIFVKTCQNKTKMKTFKNGYGNYKKKQQQLNNRIKNEKKKIFLLSIFFLLLFTLFVIVI